MIRAKQQATSMKDFAFKAVTETMVIAPDAAVLWNYMSPILLCPLMLIER